MQELSTADTSSFITLLVLLTEQGPMAIPALPQPQDTHTHTLTLTYTHTYTPPGTSTREKD